MENNIVICPHCQRAIKMIPIDDVMSAGSQSVDISPVIAELARAMNADGYRRQPTSMGHYSAMRPYALGAVAGAHAAEWDEVTYEQPARQPTVAGDVSVPFQQSLITGFFIGIGVLFVTTGAAIQWHWVWWTPFVSGFAAFLITASVQWNKLLPETRESMWKRERYINENRPEPEKPTVRIELDDPRGRQKSPGILNIGGQRTITELPITEKQLHDLSVLILRGEPLSRATAMEAGLTDGQARNLIKEMARVGYCVKRDHDPRGARITNKGLAIFKHYHTWKDKT